MGVSAWVSGSGSSIPLAFDDDLKSFDLGQVQKVWVDGASGTFTLRVAGVDKVITLGAMPCSGDGSSGTGTVQKACEDVVGAGNVKVRGLYPYVVVFKTAQAALTVDTSGLSSSRAADPLTAGTTAAATVPIASRLGVWQSVGGAFKTPGANNPTSDARYAAAVSPGNYRIAATWPGGAGFATNAKFRVYDGTTLVAVLTVDQTQASLYGDYNPYLTYQWIGCVYTSTGDLRVVVTGDADGRVWADSIVVAPFDPTSPLYVEGYGGPGYDRTAYAWSQDFSPGTWDPAPRSFRSADSRDWWRLPGRGLRAGSYRVDLNWVPYADNSAAVPVAVSADGGAPVNYSVDQTAAPSGVLHNNTYSDVPFKTLGTFSTVRGDIVAKLSVSGGATSVSAVAFVRQSLADFTRAVAGSASLVGQPGYKKNGGAVTPFPSLPLWDESGNQRFANFMLGEVLSDTDVVDVVLPDGSFTTASGPVPATTSRAANCAGSTILPVIDLDEPKTFAVGGNIGSVTSYDVHQMMEDLLKACPEPYVVSGPLVRNDDGEIVSGTAQTLLRTGQTNVLDPQGYRNIPEGEYVVRWTGAGSLSLGLDATLVADDGVVGGKRQRRYAVAPQSGRVYCDLQVTFVGPVYSPQVLTPGAPTDGSAKFFPNFVEQVRGVKLLRSMTWFDGLFHTVIDPSDLTTGTQMSWNPDTYKDVFTVTDFRTYPNTEGFVGPQYVPVLVTVDRPHNLVSMAMLTFVGPDGPGGSLTLPVTGGTVTELDFNNYTIGVYYDPDYMATNQFVIAVQGDATAVDGVVALAATASRSRRYFPPLSLLIDLCNEVGADLWFNIPPVAPHVRSDATVAAMIDQIAAGLDPSLGCWLEPYNEHWNFAFPPFHWIRQYAHKLGTTHSGAYASLCAHWHALGMSRWTAAGRPPSKFKRVFGTFTGVPSFTRDIGAFCQAHGVPIDVLATAPYIYLQPEMQPSLTAVYDAMTGEQVVDQAEVWQLLGKDVVLQNTADHRAELASYGYTDTEIYCYEMGPAYARLGGTALNQARHSQYLHKSPRYANVLFNFFKSLQDRGVVGGAMYTLFGGYGSEGGAPGTAMYGMYFGCDTPSGKGDGSDGRTDNRIDPFTVDGKVSVPGYAVKAWNAGLGATPPPPPPPPAPPRSRSRAGRGYRRRHY